MKLCDPHLAPEMWLHRTQPLTPTLIPPPSSPPMLTLFILLPLVLFFFVTSVLRRVLFSPFRLARRATRYGSRRHHGHPILTILTLFALERLYTRRF